MAVSAAATSSTDAAGAGTANGTRMELASCGGGRENSVALSGSLCGQTVPVNDREQCDVLCYLKLLRLVHRRSSSL